MQAPILSIRTEAFEKIISYSACYDRLYAVGNKMLNGIISKCRVRCEGIPSKYSSKVVELACKVVDGKFRNSKIPARFPATLCKLTIMCDIPMWNRICDSLPLLVDLELEDDHRSPVEKIKFPKSLTKLATDYYILSEDLERMPTSLTDISFDFMSDENFNFKRFPGLERLNTRLSRGENEIPSTLKSLEARGITVDGSKFPQLEYLKAHSIEGDFPCLKKLQVYSISERVDENGYYVPTPMKFSFPRNTEFSMSGAFEFKNGHLRIDRSYIAPGIEELSKRFDISSCEIANYNDLRDVHFEDFGKLESVKLFSYDISTTVIIPSVKSATLVGQAFLKVSLAPGQETDFVGNLMMKCTLMVENPTFPVGRCVYDTRWCITKMIDTSHVTEYFEAKFSKKYAKPMAAQLEKQGISYRILFKAHKKKGCLKVITDGMKIRKRK